MEDKSEEKLTSKAIEIFEIISDLEGERDKYKNQSKTLTIRITELEQIEVEYNLLLKIIGKINPPNQKEESKVLRSKKIFVMDREGNLEKMG